MKTAFFFPQAFKLYFTYNFTRSLSGRMVSYCACSAAIEKVVLMILSICRTGPYVVTRGVTSRDFSPTGSEWLISLISYSTKQPVYPVLVLYVGGRVWNDSTCVWLLQPQNGPNLCPVCSRSLKEPRVLILIQSHRFHLAELLQQGYSKVKCFLLKSLT